MKKIFIAGHKGMVGSAIFRKLKNNPNKIFIADKKKLNLLNQKSVLSFFKRNKFNEVYLCAAKVGGIHANNTYVADFIYQNLEIQNNLIHSAYLTKVKKLMFLGSSCVYPKKPKIPIKEEYLLSSELENTNEMYAIAKIAGLKMCKAYNTQFKTDFRAVMPTNLYGKNDNYDNLNSHVLAALIKKIVLAKKKNRKSFHSNVEFGKSEIKPFSTVRPIKHSMGLSLIYGCSPFGVYPYPFPRVNGGSFHPRSRYGLRSSSGT